MSKIEIDDAMVERADQECVRQWSTSNRHVMRAILDAALNPPAEPEMPVPQRMIDVGLASISDLISANCSVGSYLRGENFQRALATAYRAMEAERRKGERSERRAIRLMGGYLTYDHLRRGEDGTVPWAHRRKGDPQ